MNKRIPEVDVTAHASASGLTFHHIITKSYTFTMAQLKYACTAHQLTGFPISRDNVNVLLKSIIREHRYEIFGSYAPYTITFNGYGQLKCMQLKEGGRKLKPDEIFNTLEIACN